MTGFVVAVKNSTNTALENCSLFRNTELTSYSSEIFPTRANSSILKPLYYIEGFTTLFHKKILEANLWNISQRLCKCLKCLNLFIWELREIKFYPLQHIFDYIICFSVLKLSANSRRKREEIMGENISLNFVTFMHQVRSSQIFSFCTFLLRCKLY